MQTATLDRIIASALLVLASIGVQAKQDLPFNIESVTAFDEPWAMTFLPDGKMLVTEKKGSLLVVNADGDKRLVSGLPDVGYGGQGCLLYTSPSPRDR